MSDNPYQSPEVGNPQYSGPSLEEIKAKLAVPSILLMVSGVLNLMGSFWGMASWGLNVAGIYPTEEQKQQQMEQMEEAFGDNPDVLEIFQGLSSFGESPLALALNVIGLALGILVIVAGLRMKSVRSRGLAIGASIVSILPCFSTCCLYSIPVGIWSLIVLLNADVKQAFMENADV